MDSKEHAEDLIKEKQIKSTYTKNLSIYNLIFVSVINKLRYVTRCD